ncbi:MAG: NUDIX domain-containing protein [Candidatus Nealsonbacteria bacterium]|nr:NUDIX domain-containing protein [Candidatus Nealsonbacteria bacterium]
MEHFITGKFKSRAKFLPEKVYVQVRDSIVRGCIEAMVMDKKRTKVLLGRRNIKPWSEWWSFGSRMMPGESPAESASRTLKMDLGLDISPKRLIFLETMSLVFARREEPPQENGCHDLSVFHLVLIDEEESAAISLRHSEYQEMKWFDPKEVTVRAGFHPATVRCLKLATEYR